VEFTPTSEMATDVLTKSLTKLKHSRCLEILGISKEKKEIGHDQQESSNRGGVLTIS